MMTEGNRATINAVGVVGFIIAIFGSVLIGLNAGYKLHSSCMMLVGIAFASFGGSMFLTTCFVRLGIYCHEQLT